MTRKFVPYWIKLTAGAALVAVLTQLLFSHLDLVERWHAFAVDHEDWELDELPLIFLTLLIYLVTVLARQLRHMGVLNAELHQEIVHREVAEADLKEAITARDAFFAAMSHDLRTPINGIKGFAEIMRNESFGPIGNTKYREYAADIHRAASLLDGTIGQVLDVSRIYKEGELEVVDRPVDLCEEIRTCRDMVAGWTRADGQMSVNVECRGTTILFDPALLRRYLVNLLTNSLKYAGQGAEITVCVKPNADGGVLLIVHDTGVGVDSALVAGLTKAFSRACAGKHEYLDGAGLGLWIVKKIADAHGCGFGIDSAVGEGFSVAMTVPADRVLGPSGDCLTEAA